MKKIILRILSVIALVSMLATGQLFAGEHLTEESTKALISSQGKALFPVIISAKASSAIRRSTVKLADILSKISGGKFEVKTGNGKTGIAVGTINDFPEIQFKPRFNVQDPGERQGYEIKSHANGIYIIGASPEAVNYAVYDLLRRFAYRSYFPMKKWEIIPAKKELELAVHIREIPDYYSRNIWAGFGIWKDFQKSTKQWNIVNRNGGYKLRSGHIYGWFIMQNKEIFKKHPEYYGLLKGERKSNKLCISNPGLRKLACDYAVAIFEKNPTRSSISMDPSDGGGWCECAECIKLGTPTDRALFLANTVAEAVKKKFKGKKVGMYAYNQHSPPPNINVHPDVVISVAAGFLRGGYTLDDIIKGWSKRKATLGIREYYDVYTWSYNAPGSGRGNNLDYLKKTIPEFYKKSVRYLSSESSDDWGCNGLGYYLAQQILWNVENSKKLDSLSEDFLQNCFGPAAETMKKFYKLLNGANKHQLSADLIGRMYRLLDQAGKEAADKPEILGRLDDLAVYARYSEILMNYFNASGKAKAAGMEKLINFAARSKNTRMVHSYAIFRDTKRLARYAGMKTENMKAVDWKTSKAFTSDEIKKFIADGIVANKLLDFTPVSFNSELVPAKTLVKQAFSGGKFARARRHTVSYFTWVDKNTQPIELVVTGGLIKQYRDRGNVKIKLYKIGGASDTGTRESLVQTDTSVPPDGKTRTVKLLPKQSGLHEIVISDGGDMTAVHWKKGTPMTFVSEGPKSGIIVGTFCFYVPKGTKTLGFFSSVHRGHIVSPDGKRILKLDKNNQGFNSLPIPDGMDAKLWKLQGFAGNIELMTVPPYLAIESAGLLLPEELVKKDNL